MCGRELRQRGSDQAGRLLLFYLTPMAGGGASVTAEKTPRVLSPNAPFPAPPKICTRNLACPFGTNGEAEADDHHAELQQRLLLAMASASSPIMTGMMAVGDE